MALPLATAVVVGGVSVLVAGYASGVGDLRTGQVVLVPSASNLAGQGDRNVGTVNILACTPGELGLTVQGHVSPGSGTVSILVSASRPSGPGVRISLGEAWGLQQLPDAEFGDFQIIVPWASTTSTFAVMAKDPTGAATGTPRHGPVSKCPGGE